MFTTLQNTIFFIIISCLLFTQCHTSNVQAQTSNQMDILRISPAKKIFSVKKGQKLSYTYTEHVSVGKSEAFAISSRIIKHVDTKKEALKPNNKGKGGDAKEVTLIFEAVRAGECELTFKEMFRGEAKTERVFKVTVEG